MVISKFGNKSKAETVDYMHNERAYIETAVATKQIQKADGIFEQDGYAEPITIRACYTLFQKKI